MHWVAALAIVATVGPLSVSTPAGAVPTAEPKIAFVRYAPRIGRLRILTARIDGGGVRALRLGVSDAQGPAWSPDGRRIAFVGGTGSREARFVATNVDLYVAGSDGRRARRLTRNGDAFREAAPEWSPDGTRLVFARSSRAGNRSTLWVVGADGSAARQLTFGRTDLQPSWSPDGNRIAFVRIDASYESEIWIVRPDGTEPRRILRRLVASTRPTWSPDGSRLLLTDGATLFTVRPDGRARRLVARLVADARGGRIDPQPSWSRSGWIVFCQLRAGTLQRSDIWSVRADGSRLRRVTFSPGLDSEPAISP